MDGLVEVKGIRSCVLLAKRVLIISCCVLNFIRYFSWYPGIPLFSRSSHQIFCLLIWTWLFLAEESFRFVSCWCFMNNTFHTFSHPVFWVIFSWIEIFVSTWRDIFSSLGVYIVSIWGRFKFVPVTRGIRLSRY